MLKLATEHWDKNNMNSSSLCRIQWVVNKCREYFFNGGVEVSIQKENKLHKKYFNCELDIDRLSEPDKNNFGNLYLLDVGSCYNPFKKFNDFYTIPIDLTPATDDVIKCDFLNVHILSDKTISDIENPCEFLPKNSFNVVVFSLLLEYIPSSKQRWICCRKAYDTLKPNGLLIILTPDSKHATANSKIIKYWRYALANIGFLLVDYEKLKHLHCLMYRKCINYNVSKCWFSLQKLSEDYNPEDMICIPQDFHDYENEIVYADSTKDRYKSDSEDEFILDAFSELPSCNKDLFE